MAEELHFGRAAQRLHMTQPPLTPGDPAARARPGVPLFERTRRWVALTPAGAALLPSGAPRCWPQADALPRAGAGGGRWRWPGGCGWRFVSTVAFGPLPAWLRGFREAACRACRWSCARPPLDVQLAAFDAGEIDAGFVLHAPGAAPPGLAALASRWLEPMVLALPEAHPAAARRKADAARRSPASRW